MKQRRLRIHFQFLKKADAAKDLVEHENIEK